jgi:carboxyl-terminal processing protease
MRYRTHTRWLGMLVLVLMPCSVSVAQQLDGEQQKLRKDMAEQLMQAVELAEEYHLSRIKLDDAFSSRWFDRFLLSVDPKRMYFLQADLDRFAKYRKQLDDEARAEQATKWAQEFVKADHDFTIDEEFMRRQATWAKDSKALQERWRKRIKFELLFEKINDVKRNAAIKRLSGRYSRIQERSQAFDFEERATVFMSDMAQTFDHNSVYLSPSDLEWFRGGFIRFLTIGVTIRSERGEFVIADPLPVHGSAGRHGVRHGDIVTGIGTLDNTKFFDITEMSNWDLTGLMRR